MQYYRVSEIGDLIDLVDNPHPSEPVDSEGIMAQPPEMREASFVDVNQPFTGIYWIPMPSVTIKYCQGVASFSTITVMSNHNLTMVHFIKAHLVNHTTT